MNSQLIKNNYLNLFLYKFKYKNIIYTMNKKIGLFIKTYSNEKTSNIRIDIIEECFISLKNNVDSDIVKILIVDQAQNDYHKEIINKYSNIFNEIIYNDYNKGISVCQNIGIRRLIYTYDVDIGFGCDDDIIIHKNGINRYVEVIIKSNIPHFCYFPYNELLQALQIGPNDIYQKLYKDNILFVKGGVCGCFFSFTKEMIKMIGYFPKLSYVYGGEHEVFTCNYMKGSYSYDIISSNSQIKNNDKNIELNKRSNKYSSMNNIDENLFAKNSTECNIYKQDLGKYYYYYDHSYLINIILFNTTDNIDINDNIINKILCSSYLNYEIIIINDKDNINNNNENIYKYLDKLYIKIIESNIDKFFNNIKNKTYIFNRINTNNNNINFIENIDEIIELKKNIINTNSIEYIIDNNTNLFELQKNMILTSKNINLKIYKKSFSNLTNIKSFIKCMNNGYFYKNSSIKINNKIKILWI